MRTKNRGGDALCLEIDGASLSIEDALEVACGGRLVALSTDAARAVRDCRDLRLRLTASGSPIYGVTTGFGDTAHRQIAFGSRPAAAEHAALPRVRDGPIASPEVTRLAMLLRANCLAKGNSGVRLELVERLLALLNHDVLPLIPERGSCGASGDLIPLSYVGRALTGETVALRGRGPRGRRRAGRAWAGAAGAGGQGGPCAHQRDVVHECVRRLAVAARASSRSSPTSARRWPRRRCSATAATSTASSSRPSRTRGWSRARATSAALADSTLARDSEEESARARRRGLPRAHALRPGQVLDPLRAAHHRRAARHARVGRALGADRDQLVRRQPALRRDAGRVQSGGNFYGWHVAQAMDSLKIALANLCDLIDRQLELVVDEKFNAGLTPNLIRRLRRTTPRPACTTASRGCSSAARR